MNIGSIVRCRNREWVVLPSANPEIVLLRPLTGGESEICGIYLPLANLGLDRLESATFPLPKPDDASDAVSAELLWNAARLTLRDGAGPFRSLGRLSFRPRAFQFVPLLMALRLKVIRLLIADDVGVGKTIEALLVARELLDRGEVQRICVLCPPYLCEQWRKELWEKFQIEAVVIRSGTISQLERQLSSGDQSIFGYYPHIVVSIDYAKSDRHCANFLQHCPELVIVDEAHGAARPAGHARAQQQRHELLRDVACMPNRHVILLTATPHSGVQESFLSLLELLKYDFARLDLHRLSGDERDDLARHFVQRRRADIARWLGEDTPFPERESIEETYDLSPQYRKLFERVYEFSRELVRTGETLTGWKRRIRYWTALALLRCVMSSPAAGIATLEAKARGRLLDEEASDDAYAPYIYEPTDEETLDVVPTHIVEEGETELPEDEKRRLREFARLAVSIEHSDEDRKVLKCVEIVRRFLREGYHPIVWCRYIATSNYIAEQLKQRLGNEFPDLHVVSITGELPEDERRALVEELAQSPRRVLVATDCLSEGINLQEQFTAVVHYDLPWNPNRLEQREGRVDRFGQCAPKVKAVLLYGRDNPVDGAVLNVLLGKAKEIYRATGVNVPVPKDSETVMEAVLKALFFRAPRAEQLLLFEDPEVQDIHRQWDEAAAREKESRTRFAQRAIKPEEVERELQETDSVLGDPSAVQRFVLNACQRLGASIRHSGSGRWVITNLYQLPELIRASVSDAPEEWRVTFTTPAPEGLTYLGRNHPFVAALAQYLLEASLTQSAQAPAARCGVLRTRSVERRTSLALLRLRFTLEEPGKRALLAEEVFPCAFRGFPPDRVEGLSESEALTLLQRAQPDANLSPEERREVLGEILGWWNDLQPEFEHLIEQRARRLEDAHRRVRATVGLPRRGLSVRPHLPPDLLGILVLLPVPKGIAEGKTLFAD